MKPPGADPVMTPRDHGAGGSVGHHQHAASRCPGCGGRHGHRGQPEGPPCRGPGRRARHAGVPGAGTGRRADARLAAAGEARPSQNPLFCAPEACRGCHHSLARNRRYWPGMQHCGVADPAQWPSWSWPRASAGYPAAPLLAGACLAGHGFGRVIKACCQVVSCAVGSGGVVHDAVVAAAVAGAAGAGAVPG